MNNDELIKLQNLAYCGDKTALNRYYDYCYENKQYEKGFTILKRFEESLDEEALRKLAYCYLHGLGTEISLNKAKEYYQKAYDNGDVASGYNLAIIYYKEKNYEKAVPYLSYGVFKNHERSISLLADLYANGLGVDRNSGIAINLYKKLLNEGNHLIFDKIGRIYYQDADYYNAVKYFNSGAKKLDPEALYHLGICYFKGQGVPIDAAKAVYYYDLGASQNHIKCLKNLIFHYEKGIGVLVNLRKVEIYKKKLESLKE